jgi:RNA polymerase sigma-70 factor (ECF subfamily)
MSHDAQSITSITLLGRLQGATPDEMAWREFVNRYGPKIQGWCRKRQLQEADAEDLTQTVLTKLVSRLRTFRYDPSQSFRAWLKTVTLHALADFAAQRHRPGQGSGDPRTLEYLASQEARQDFLAELADEFDRELLEEAKARVQLRVGPAKWQAFCLTAFESLSGEEAARRLGMKVITVYTAKSKVLKLLQEEVTRLECPPPEER